MKSTGTTAYGLDWPTENRLEIELEFIRKGGTLEISGKTYGKGLFHHYRALETLLWPEVVHHRWDDLLLRNFIENRITGVMGPASSGKTSRACRYGLMKYLAFPHNTTVLVSSTDSRSLELKIWGQLKHWYALARRRWPECPGRMVESRQLIVTDTAKPVEDEDEFSVRDWTNGIICIPCMVGGTFVGLGKYVGIKNENVILIADEAQFMARAFFDAISNLNKNVGLQGIVLGNPKDPSDCLGLICEPHADEGGWEGVVQGVKTTGWRCRMPETRCVQLVGTDSPNFDTPEDQPVPFPFLIGRKAIKNDLEYYGPDSLQFQMMDLGVMPKSAHARRVLSKTLCDENNVRAGPVWADNQQTHLIGLDAAYSAVGGDRSALIHLAFGRGISGRDLAAMMGPPIVVPVKNPKRSAEHQIVEWVKDYAEKHSIPPERVFFDSTGRGTLMSAFGLLWSPGVVPVEFGGKASERIVSNVIQVPACEHFSKRVSELWFNVRYLIEAGQLCGMTDDVIDEGCMREWGMVAGNRVEVEGKDKTKQRMGRSPDLMDALAVAVEGARMMGLTVRRLLEPMDAARFQERMRQIQDSYQRVRESKKLHSVS